MTVAVPDLAQELVQLGTAIGVLRPAAGGGADGFTLNPDWFEDPGRYLGDVLRDPDQREATIRLAEAVLGVGDGELDLHGVPPGEKWLPIVVSSDPDAGLFAVIDTDVTATGEDVLLSLGGRLATAETLAGVRIQSACTVLVPLLRVRGGVAGDAPPPGAAEFLVGSPDGVVRVGVSVSLEGGLGTSVELHGAVIDVAIPTDGTPSAIAVVLRGLRLPGEDAPRDVALSELDELGAEAFEVAVGLLIARLDEASPGLRHILALLGIDPTTGIPQLPVAEALRDGTAVVTRWVRQVVSDPATFRAWAEELAAFLGAPTPLPGLGTSAAPLLICVGTDPELCVSVGVERDPVTGTPVIRPGVRISADASGTAPVPARFVGEAELGAVSLGPNVDGRALPSLELCVELGSEVPGAGALVETTLPAPAAVTVSIGRARVGLALDDQRRLAPVLDALDVAIDGIAYPVLDLSSADAVADAVSGALDAVVRSLLDALEGTPRGRALAALAGLVRPTGVADGDPWPSLPAIQDLFAEPVAALLCYHVGLLEPMGGSVPWVRMVSELANLLRSPGTAGAEPSGNGTEQDPWSARVFDNTASTDDVRGAVDVVAWSQAGTAPNGGPDLVLASRWSTTGIFIGGKTLTLSITSQIVRLSLPPRAECPGAVTAAWAPCHTVEARFGAGLELDAGQVVLLADAVVAASRWSREGGLQAAVTIERPVIRLGTTAAPLPDLAYPFGGPLELPSTATLPWFQLELVLGQLLESLGSFGTRVAALLGWSPSVGDIVIEPARLSGLSLELDAGTMPHLPLDLLLIDPAAAFRQWLGSLTEASGDWPDVTLPAIAWLSSLLGGIEAIDGRLTAAVVGIGTYEEPWAFQLGGAAGAPEVLVWVDPSGPSLAGVPGIVGHLVPDELRDAVGGGAPSATAERLVELLRRASAVSPTLRDALGDLPGLADALGALRHRVADGDGLVAAADQRIPADAPDAARWSEGALGETSHLREPAAFDPDTHLGVGAPAPARRIFVSSPLPHASPWPGQETAPPDHVIDLRAPGLAPEAFDLSVIAAEDGAGPWYVLLPPRAAGGGLSGLVGRLRRAVAAVRDALGTGPLAVIAHGTSGHVARLLATEGGITHLVTMGTPHGGATFEFLDRPQTSDAIRLLRRLGALAVDEIDPTLASLLATLSVALDGYVARPDGTSGHVPLPVDDFSPPTFPALHADTTFARTLVGRIPPETFDAGLAGLTMSVLVGAADALPGWTPAPDEPLAPTHVGFGLRAPLASGDGALGTLTVDASARLDLARVALRPGEERQLPQLTLRAEARRVGGWLVGGPDPEHPAGTPRDPRVRSAALTLRTGLDPIDPSAAVELRDASVFGSSRAVWLVDREEVSPEARVLIGEVASGLGAIAPTGPLRGLADVLATVGAVEFAADGTATVVADALERFLLEPLDELRRRIGRGAPGREAFVAAIRSWLGATSSGEDAVVAPLGAEWELVVGLGVPPSLELRTSAAGFTLGPAARLDGSLAFDASGRLTAHIRTTALPDLAPAPALAAEVSVDTAAGESVRVRLEEGRVALELYPIPSEELSSRGAALVLGELLRLAAEWAAAQAPEVVALLEALALRRGGRVRNLGYLVREPAAWLTHAVVLGRDSGIPGLDPTSLRQLVSAARDLTAPGAPDDRLPLPWGLELSVGDAGSDPVLAFVWAPPATDDVNLHGELRLRVGAGPEVTADLAGGITLRGLEGLDEVGLDLDLHGIETARLHLRPTGGVEVVLPLLPRSPGLGALADLAGAAVNHVLPLALDALARVADPLGPAFGAFGDALGLRTGAPPRFRAEELRRLGSDPAGELQGRLRRHPGAALGAARSLLAPLLPVGGTVFDGARPGSGVPFLEVAPVAAVSVALEVPPAAPPRLCATVAGIEPLAGLGVGGRACVTSSGIEALTLDVEVTSATLLALGGVPLLPFARLLVSGSEPPGPDHRLELGIWTAPAPSPADRCGIVVKLPFGGDPSVACRSADGTTDSSDLGACRALAVRALLVPLGAEVVLSTAPVIARLEKPLDGGVRIGQILHDAALLVRTPAAGSATYDLADGALDPAAFGRRVLALGARVVDALGEGFGAGDRLAPVTVNLARRDHGGRTVHGIRIGLAEPLELFAARGVRLRLEADASWMGETPPPTAGVELLVVSLPTGSLDPVDVKIHPWISVNGVGVRALGTEGGKLIDLVASVESVALHGVYRRNAAEDAADGVELAGGRLTLDRFAVPLGRASGGNPVAAKLLSQGQEEQQAGDREELAPAFSPQLILLRRPPGSTALTFRAGEGDGPWWVPVQQRFGPLYVEQVGLDTVEVAGELDRVKAILDGGVALAGLTVGLDDLSVSIPWHRPWELTDWRLDLAGLALGYDSGGISLAGGLRRRPGPSPDYVGLVLVRTVELGVTAVAGYAEIPEAPSSTRTYTSLFVFAAVSYPLGGPPAFFVTGLGGGAGLNRRLVVPDEVTDVPRFPLVAAMDPGSPFARDPMGSLDTLGAVFPPQRGTFWFAAGIRFTSFVLVESVAVLSVEVGDGGTEVAVLGLSRMDLPNRDFALARVELALRARFSSREGVLAVQGQLTDNSYLISPDCRLTGGFAFVTFFKGELRGQFVLTLGGYHRRFEKPAAFPLVPRLGFDWLASSTVTVKGEAYFALTATCVMAGGRLEAAYKTSVVWASFTAGVDGVVSWDPFFYDVSVYVRVSAGVDIKVCFFHCFRVRTSLSIGAEVHVFGPEIRGTAKLDLDVTSVTVSFGPTGSTNGKDDLGWNEFRNKYLVDGDPEGLTMGATVAAGLLVPDPAAGRDDADTGKLERPWRVVAEFALITVTRAASNDVNGRALTPVTPQQLDLGPMGAAGVVSAHRVRIRNRGTGADETARLELEPVVGNVPEGIWRRLPESDAAPEAKVRPAFVGAIMTARATVPPVEARASLEQVETSEQPLPLPFADEQDDRGAFTGDVEHADTYVGAQPTDAASVLAYAREKLAVGFAASPLGRLQRSVFAAERAAPPRLVPLTEGMVDAIKPPAGLVAEPPEPEPPRPDPRIAPPRLRALLRSTPPVDLRGPVRTTVAETASSLPRVAAPTLAEARAATASRGPARLVVAAPRPDEVRETILPADGGPPTARAGGLTELRAGLLLHEETAAAVEQLQAALASGEGVSLTAGDLFVWELPNAENDSGEARPTLSVTGDQHVRLVVVDRGGTVLADQTGQTLELALPRGACRFAAAGLGVPTALDGDPTGLAGWHAGTRLRQIVDHIFLAPGAVIRSSSPLATRARRPVGAAVVPAAAAVQGRGAVATRLAPTTRSVAVAIQTTEDLDDRLDGLVLGLEGAVRRGEPHQPEPPVLVVSGPRVHGVFAIEPEVDADAVVVTVASDERWQLSGVVGSVGEPEEFAAELADRGLEGLLCEETSSPLGRSELRWRQEDEVD